MCHEVCHGCDNLIKLWTIIRADHWGWSHVTRSYVICPIIFADHDTMLIRSEYNLQLPIKATKFLILSKNYKYTSFLLVTLDIPCCTLLLCRVPIKLAGPIKLAKLGYSQNFIFAPRPATADKSWTEPWRQMWTLSLILHSSQSLCGFVKVK